MVEENKNSEITKEKTKYFNWIKIYIFLVFFSIATILFSVFLVTSLTGIHDTSVRNSQEWVSYHDEVLKAIDYVMQSNAPGNDIFKSNDPDFEEKRFDKLYKQAIVQINKLITNMPSEISIINMRAINIQQNEILRAIEDSGLAAQHVFDFFRAEKKEEASGAMAAMDKNNSNVLSQLISLAQELDSLKSKKLEREEKEVHVLESYKYLLIFIAGIMIILVSFYSYKLARKMEGDEKEQKKSREGLSNTVQELRAVLNTVVDGIITIDDRGNIQSFNPSAEDIFGYSADEVIGQNVKMLMPSPYHKEHDGYLNNYLRGGEAKVIGIGREVEAMRKDGSTFPMELGVSEFDVNNNCMFVGIIRDISERKNAEQSLNNKVQELGAVLNTVIDGIITIDDRGNVQSFNPSAENIFGYSADEVIGQNVKMLMPSPYHEEHDGYLSNYLHSGEAKVIGIGREVEAQRKDGSTFPMELGVSEFSINNNRMFVGIIRDISERKESEVKLHQYTVEIEAAKMQAENANQMKGEFLANMSHEIRTPINGIMGMSELLLETQQSSKQLSYTKTILNSANSLLGIINDILDFSKIEAGKVDIDPIPMDLRELCEDVVDLLSVKSIEKDLEIILDYNKNTPSNVIGDVTRVRQLISNLLGNAIKFTEKGYVSLSVEEYKELSDDNSKIGLLFKVKDTGIGIPKEAQQKIFDKFSQADASTTRKFGGTGLGLSICKKLSNIMGGDIWLNSEPNKGSEFCFTIVLDKNETSVEGADDLFNKNILEGARVLVIDDLEINREVVRNMLESSGAEVAVCDSADSALAMLNQISQSKNILDLIIVDNIMPKRSGEILAQEIHETEEFKDIPIIMMTSYGGVAYSEKIQKMGFSGFVSKPLRLKDLLLIVAKVIDNKNEGRTREFVTAYDITADKHGNKDNKNIRLKEPSILLVEDNRVNQMFAEDVLQGANCKVEIASNGTQAVDMFKSGSYDLILMDCQMPIMDGFEATRTIRGIKDGDNKAQDIPIIALTANAMQGDRERCIEAGMNDYLSKPLSKTDLIGAIAKFLPEFVDEDSEVFISDSNKEKMFRGMHALLVEDNRTNIIMAEEILEEMGFSVSTVMNGKKAVEVIQQKDFDVVLMDCQMPVMDGYEATKRICALKKENTIKDMPIIAITANAMQGDRERCLESGMNDYLSKPIKKQPFVNMIKKLVRGGIKDSMGDHLNNIESINDNALQSSKDLMGERFPQFTIRYLEDTKQILDRLDNYCRNGDIKGLHVAVHSIKSTSAIMGAMKFSIIAERMETQVINAIEIEGDLRDVDMGLIDMLHEEFNAVEDELKHRVLIG